MHVSPQHLHSKIKTKESSGQGTSLPLVPAPTLHLLAWNNAGEGVDGQSGRTGLHSALCHRSEDRRYKSKQHDVHRWAWESLREIKLREFSSPGLERSRCHHLKWKYFILSQESAIQTVLNFKYFPTKTPQLSQEPSRPFQEVKVELQAFLLTALWWG